MTIRNLGLASLCIAAALAAPACQRREGLAPEPANGEPSAAADRPAATEGETQPTPARRAQASRRPPAGATCSGRDDCTSDQVCVESRCSYRATSVAGEVLASAAEAQAQAGDWSGALETYELSFRAFETADAPVSPEIACGAAELILRTATDADARERGARRADLCFRITVPTHPGRLAVRRALARLRFEGLDIGRFDQAEPAERFFTQQPSRPTVDAVEVDVQMPDLEPREPPAHTGVRERLLSEDGTAAIAECFIQDWETNHDRSAAAELAMSFSSRLRDLGSYDVFEPSLVINKTTTAEDGFEPCLAAALPGLFDPSNRSLRGDAWTQTVRITARIQ